VRRRHPPTDVAVVGVGWAGSIIAAELAKAGLSVVGLERGPRLDPTATADAMDELRYSSRAVLAQDLSRETWTLRHDDREAALPLRMSASFRPGEVVGGSGVSWGGVARRWLPHQFRLRSTLVELHGQAALPADSTLQDWPLDYTELEPYYDRFERAIGVTGQAGNIDGRRVPGGNPFEGPRTRDYPMPPLEGDDATSGFAAAATALGLHPYPQPTANASRAYTTPDGVALGACASCGRCAFHPCAFGAKADPRVITIPVAEATGRFELRPRARVTRILRAGRRVAGVLYVDADGEVHEQPAAVVVLAAYALGNVRLLLLSGIGTPYDPRTGEGTVGRNYTYQAGSSCRGFFADRTFRRYRGANGVAVCVDDLSVPPEAHPGFLGGGSIACRTVGGPLLGVPVPPGTPSWGPEWKQALRRWSHRSVVATSSADVLPYRGHHLDLDPRYCDAWGDPLLRITYDWRANERALVAHLNARIAAILREMGASVVDAPADLATPYDGATYHSTHNNGGAVMGDDPATSVVNRYLQAWDADNLFVVGASAFPYNSGHGPTGTVGALSYRAAESILEYSGAGRLA
jgi:gluconate 2-dehydrogenase alpha chain